MLLSFKDTSNLIRISCKHYEMQELCRGGFSGWHVIVVARLPRTSASSRVCARSRVMPEGLRNITEHIHSLYPSCVCPERIL